MKYYQALTFEGRKALLSTQLDAKPYQKLGTVEVVDVPTDKEALRQFVNDLYTRIFELETATVQEQLPADLPPPAAPAPEREPSYTQWTVGLDESWDKLPLSHKLHFAALAMEEARKAL